MSNKNKIMNNKNGPQMQRNDQTVVHQFSAAYQGKSQIQNNILYVTNFSRQMTKKQFQSIFCQFGKVIDISIFASFKIQIPYAFIEYDDLRDAVAAKNKIHNTFFNGVLIKVQYKKAKPLLKSHASSPSQQEYYSSIHNQTSKFSSNPPSEIHQQMNTALLEQKNPNRVMNNVFLKPEQTNKKLQQISKTSMVISSEPDKQTLKSKIFSTSLNKCEPKLFNEALQNRAATKLLEKMTLESNQPYNLTKTPQKNDPHQRAQAQNKNLGKSLLLQKANQIEQHTNKSMLKQNQKSNLYKKESDSSSSSSSSSSSDSSSDSSSEKKRRDDSSSYYKKRRVERNYKQSRSKEKSYSKGKERLKKYDRKYYARRERSRSRSRQLNKYKEHGSHRRRSKYREEYKQRIPSYEQKSYQIERPNMDQEYKNRMRSEYSFSKNQLDYSEVRSKKIDFPVFGNRYNSVDMMGFDIEPNMWQLQSQITGLFRLNEQLSNKTAYLQKRLAEAEKVIFRNQSLRMVNQQADLQSKFFKRQSTHQKQLRYAELLNSSKPDQRQRQTF